jgi:hypothetical protein
MYNFTGNNSLSLLFLQDDFFDNKVYNIENSTYKYKFFSGDNKNLTSIENIENEIRIIVGLIAAIFNGLSIIVFAISFFLRRSGKGFELIVYMNIASLINVISYLLLFKGFSSELNPQEYQICDWQGPLMVS